SSLAELAAMRVPAVLVPYSTATDGHQFPNARAVAETGAARLLQQEGATAEAIAGQIFGIGDCHATSQNKPKAPAAWQKPRAAEEIDDVMLDSVRVRRKALNKFKRLNGLNNLQTQEEVEETIAEHA